MAAPIDSSTSASVLRTSGIRSKNAAPKKTSPGDLPFTRAAAPEKPAASTAGESVGEPADIGRNDFPTSLLFTNSEGVQSKIRRASIGAPSAPSSRAAASAGNGETRPA